MLTALKVKGFKNLADVDVAFGPFTCVAGVNGVGKSNLFDALTFLSALADRPLMDAARCVRDERNRSTDVRSLFLALADDEHVDEMSFEAEMLVSPEGDDDLGQHAHATITFLKYTLVLGYRKTDDTSLRERLEVKREELKHINIGDAPKHLRFQHSKKWRDSVVRGKRFGAAFLSTERKGAERVIKLHQDGGAGRPRSLLAENLPRTVISSTNAVESPTALLARREMQSWRLLQLEPSSLRASDPFTAPTRIGADGSHMAATLHHLAKTNGSETTLDDEAIYAQVANRLSELINDVRSVRVNKDEKRELLTLQLEDSAHRLHAARALSDGTLRFLALAILERDPHAQGLLCFEEPENGIHPDRIEAMLSLLNDLAVDPNERLGPANPLRQVIVNTHSPSVVARVPDADLLIAQPREMIVEGHRVQTVHFTWLDDTWRSVRQPEVPCVSRGRLRAYLDPFAAREDWGYEPERPSGRTKKGAWVRRVIDREDLQLFLPIDELD